MLVIQSDPNSEVSAQCGKRNNSKGTWSFPGTEQAESSSNPCSLVVISWVLPNRLTQAHSPSSAPWARCAPQFRTVCFLKEPKDADMQCAVSPGRSGEEPVIKHKYFYDKRHAWFLLRARDKEYNFFSHKIQLRFCHQMSLPKTYQKHFFF